MKSDRPAKILFCETNTDGTVGGSYYSLLYLVKGLDRTQYHPIVLFCADHTLMPAFREAGIDTLVWPRGKAVTFGGDLRGGLRWLRLPAVVIQKTLNFLRGSLVATIAQAWFLRAHDISIVHLNNTIKRNHDWMVAARLAGKKCLSHERGINDAYSAAAKYLGKRLDAIVCISGAVFENMHKRGAGFANLVKIHNGLDPDMMRIKTPPHDLRAAYRIEADAPVIVMVGNIRPWKGQETVIRAIERVRRAWPSVRCVFVGDTAPADREYDRTVRSLVSELDLTAHVIFAGFQHNVADFLMMSDVVVHASVLPEPFGRVILEAMACRKPVIGARAGAVPELVTEGQTGLTFPPGDSVLLADAVLSLIRDRQEARRLGQNGYDRLIREFNIDRNVRLTECLYEKILSAKH